jgi:hypothetical protein
MSRTGNISHWHDGAIEILRALFSGTGDQSRRRRHWGAVLPTPGAPRMGVAVPIGVAVPHAEDFLRIMTNDMAQT